MSYYKELNQLCMEKLASRSYGRNPDGTRRTVEQLIAWLKMSKPHPKLGTQIKNLSAINLEGDNLKKNKPKASNHRQVI